MKVSRFLLVPAIAGLLASTAGAAIWAPAYVWSAQQYGGSKFIHGNGATDNWGLFLEAGPGGNNTAGIQTFNWVPNGDRTGLYSAQRDLSGPNPSAKWKYRTDSGVPAGGPGMTYTQAVGMAIGIKVDATASFSQTATSHIPASELYPRLRIDANKAGIRLGYVSAAQTVLGVPTNWIANDPDTFIDTITGNWSQPLHTWGTIKLVLNNEQAGTITWTAENLNGGTMTGHAVSGQDAGGRVSFYSDNTHITGDWTTDYVAFGTGTNIGAIPEPATFALLALGVLPLVRRRRA